MTYTDSPEHRAAVYASHHADPLLREWAKRDFLEWLERRDQQTWEAGYDAATK